MRQYLMEIIGTFFFTMAIAFTRDPTAIGLMLIAMTYIGANISGAHYNPVITFAAMIRKKMDFNDGIMYMGSQVVGALLAGLLFNLVVEEVFVPAGAPQVAPYLAVSMEAILAAAFCMVVMAVFGKTMKGNMVYGLAIGFSLIALLGVVGVLLNPAVAAGAMLCNIIQNGPFKDGMSALIYVGGPLLGSILAVYTYGYLADEK